MLDFGASSVLFWTSVFIVLFYKGGGALVRKVKKNQFEGYEDNE